MEGERQRVYSEVRQAKEMRFTHMDRVNPESYVQVRRGVRRFCGVVGS